MIARFQFLSCFFPAQQSLTKEIFRVYNSISNRFTRFFMIYGWYMIYLLSQMWQDRINFWVIFKKTSYILVVYISGVLVHFTPCSILGGRSISTFCPLGYFWAYIYILYICIYIYIYIYIYKTSIFWVQSSKRFLNYINGLNYFKYFPICFGTKCLKNQRRNFFELYKVFIHNFLWQNGKLFMKVLELYQVFVWQNVSILLMHIKSITP